MNFQTAKVTTGYITVLSVKGGRTPRELRAEDDCRGDQRKQMPDRGRTKYL